MSEGNPKEMSLKQPLETSRAERQGESTPSKGTSVSKGSLASRAKCGERAVGVYQR